MRKDVIGANKDDKKYNYENRFELLGARGHRGRVKEEILRCCGRGMREHRLLEFLLFFCIPQKDTKPIAYELINRFGNLYGVCNADPELLKNVKGMTNDAVVFLRSMDGVFDTYGEESGKQYKLEGVEGVLHYMRKIVTPGVEACYVINLDNDDEIIGVEKVMEGAINALDIPTGLIVKAALDAHSRRIIVMHTHPSGEIEPSGADRANTFAMNRLFHELNIEMVDHIVVYEKFAGSMKEKKIYRHNWSMR